MTFTDLKTALALHQKAFAFLMDCRATGRAGSRLLDETIVAAWQHANSCTEWLARFRDQIAPSFRPEVDEIEPFAFYLSSFLSTSFCASRVNRHGAWRFELRALPERRPDGSKKSRHTKEKEYQTANNLRRHALEALASECSLESEPWPLIQQTPAHWRDLTLWTYASHLVHRSQYASQGPALYRLWLELPEKMRRQFDAELVWVARTRLLQFLKSISTITES